MSRIWSWVLTGFIARCLIKRDIPKASDALGLVGRFRAHMLHHEFFWHLVCSHGMSCARMTRYEYLWCAMVIHEHREGSECIISNADASRICIASIKNVESEWNVRVSRMIWVLGYWWWGKVMFPGRYVPVGCRVGNRYVEGESPTFG